MDNNEQKYYIDGCISASFFLENDFYELSDEIFTINKEYNCIVARGYGAWMANAEDENINYNFFEDYINKGYEIVIGPPTNKSFAFSLYCKNYKDVAIPCLDNDDYYDELDDFDYFDGFDSNDIFDDVNYTSNINNDLDDKNNKKPKKETKTEDKPKKKKLELKDINEIIDNVKRKFIGQEDAIEDIVTNIYANQIIIDKNKDLLQTQKASILIDGPTGTGKTAIMKEIAKELNIPIVITSATQYSQTGYVGQSIDSVLEKLLEQANGDIELAQRGIICFDEIDKLGYEKDNINKDNMHESVQEEILSYMSGEKVKVRSTTSSKEFDTTNTTFIGMGAFTDLRENKIKYGSINDDEPKIGFNAPIRKKSQDKQYIITEQDYIDYGLKRELVGRFTLQTYTRSYSKDDYINILKNSEISPIKQFEEFAHTLGVENVIYDDEFLNDLSSQAYDDNFGARGLQKIVNDLKNSLLLNMINSKEKTITLTSDMLKKCKEKNIRRY